MSRSSTESTRRSISDETGLGKRTADDDERSNLTERQKRLRRDGSSNQLDEEEAQDSIVVALRKEFEKSDAQPETGIRTAPSSQPSSSFSSPLSNAHSRLAEESGEMAQKAMEAWQNATGVKSDLNRQELLPVRATQTGENRNVVSPRSPGLSTSDGSAQPRDWLSASDERQYRTPLPTQKESRQPDILSATEDLPARDGDTSQINYHSTSQSNDQSRSIDQGSRSGPPIKSEADQQSTNHTNDYLRSIAKDTIQLSVRDAPRWQAGVETRQLPPLPSLGMGFPPMARNNMPRQVGPHSPKGSLNSFPSTFSVLTSDEIQRNQSSNRGGRKRSKRPPDPPGARGHLEDRPISQGMGSGDIHQETIAFRQEVRSDDGQPRSSPDFRDLHLQQGIRRPVSAASALPHILHVTQSKDSAIPPLHSTTQGSFRPPPVTFTIDNRAESPLQTSEVQPLIESFTQHTAVILPTTPSGKEAGSHPISMIMWQGLAEFYKWYAQMLQVQEIGPLMFELVDVNWQEERSFVVPEGNQSYFRTMKQYVWDLYWFAVHVNKGPTPFRVRVTKFTPQIPRSPPKIDSQWKVGGSPGRRSGVDQQSHVIVESRPGPLYPHQQPPVRPPASAPVTIPRPFSSHDARMPSTAHHPRSQRDSFNTIQPLNDDNLRQPITVVSPQIGHARTARDQAMLRERAHAYLAERQDLELLDQESTVRDKLPYKTGAEVCGVVVDKRSGKGMVAITGKGYITQNVQTGPDEPGDRYHDFTIQPKQTCMLHGDAVVLFYKHRQTTPETASQMKPRTESRGQAQLTSGSEVEIIIRLQMDGSGRYSAAFDKSVLRPKITTTEFFSFFANQSGHCAPTGPSHLKFTFKDAMPAPTSTEIARGNEDHFNYMRKDIKIQCEKAKKFMGDLKEFVILVTVPGWTTVEGDEEEEW